MVSRVLPRLSGLQIGWLTFWAVVIGLALASERLSNTANLLVVGGVFLSAGLAAASAYLVSSGALRRRGSRANWSAFFLLTIFNVAATTVVAALLLDR
jgi:hypothetical protein